jgi:hypothetical protein
MVHGRIRFKLADLMQLISLSRKNLIFYEMKLFKDIYHHPNLRRQVVLVVPWFFLAIVGYELIRLYSIPIFRVEENEESIPDQSCSRIALSKQLKYCSV